MMDWTDRHCRYFLRQVSSRAFLYTEMITTGALLHGNVERHLAFSGEEHPVGAQLGGSEPDELARCARLVEQYGYDEVNLNIGCPSERVQRGAFGACLMAEPELVADCVRAMREAVKIPVTVKHRIGLNAMDDFSFMEKFVGTVSKAGCHTFIVHARNAVLKGLSPKENREIPPLKYDYVYRLKRDFPSLEIVLNGGLARADLLPGVDGIMLGRAAYHDPFLLAGVDSSVFCDDAPITTREAIVLTMTEYLRQQTRAGVAPRHVVRHVLGLFQSLRGARQWRRTLSDADMLQRYGADVLLYALEAVKDQTTLAPAVA